MPIFHKHKLIMIHIPKTGGEAVNKYMGCGPGVFVNERPNRRCLYGITKDYCLQHLTCQQMLDKGFVTPEIFNSYHKFAIVRNPYDRLVSEFCWTGHKKFYQKHATFEEFIKDLPNLMKLEKYAHFRPQNEFIYDSDGNLMVDEVLRFENFGTEVKQLLNKYGVKANTKKRVNSTRRGKSDDYYTDELREIVREHYRKDFELFGYDM
jgi:hypothetical protein